MAMPGARIFQLSRLELAITPYHWAFAQARCADIEAHFATIRAATPAVWNGRVLLMREHMIAGDTLRGVFFETGFADFVAWRDWDCPDRSVINCFAMAALRAADGAYLMGVMGPDTVNPGLVYFPAGTPDPADLRGDTVDLLGNVMREVAEETGLTAHDFVAGFGWDAVVAGQRLALMKPIAVPCPAEEARHRILRHLAREAQPELSDVRIVRSPQDFEPMMPDFVTAYLSHLWAGS